MPKIGASHEIPTSENPPPAAGLKRAVGQCSNSPTRRNNVIARVIRNGTKINLEMLISLPERSAVMGASCESSLYRYSLVDRTIISKNAVVKWESTPSDLS